MGQHKGGLMAQETTPQFEMDPSVDPRSPEGIIDIQREFTATVAKNLLQILKDTEPEYDPREISGMYGKTMEDGSIVYERPMG